MTTAPSILVLGNDLTLLDTRASVLKMAGYTVKALGASQGMPPIKTVDLVILCHTLSEAERNTFLRIASVQSPAASTLCLTPAKGSLEGIANLFNSFDGPVKLLETVRELLIRQQLT